MVMLREHRMRSLCPQSCYNPRMLPNLEPMRLTRCREPFHHAEWIIELNLAGFQARAYVEKC